MRVRRQIAAGQIDAPAVEQLTPGRDRDQHGRVAVLGDAHGCRWLGWFARHFFSLSAATIAAVQPRAEAVSSVQILPWIGSMTLVAEREHMVQTQLASRGISDARVLDAFRTVPREAFIPDELAEIAYRDTPLPIGDGQTISQPYIVALMAEALILSGDDHVLEVGAGSGYAAAILSRLAADVIAVERVPELAATAAARLQELGYETVRVVAGDGSTGVADAAPFDAICVSASAPRVPRALVAQLAPGGRLVVPIGTPDEQELVRVRVDHVGRARTERLGAVRFVPLVGEEGWQA
jgi:protein-L-isoaspartate(D-aspartate) O-methyltransferase